MTKINTKLNSFKKKHTLDERQNESTKIIKKYAGRIPVIVTKDSKCKLDDMDRNKFLAPGDLTLGQFMYVIRKRINLTETESIFMFVNETVLAPTSHTMNALYEQYKDEDGFLYFVYCNENVFG
jgi:GABA(A) receptor-associated protein